jgi:hypothetical protein
MKKFAAFGRQHGIFSFQIEKGFLPVLQRGIK